MSWLTRSTKEGGQGFVQSPHDPCLISKIEREAPNLFKKNTVVRLLLISKKVADKEMWIALYVDDLLMAGHSELIEPFVKDISKEYVIRDLGVPEVFLGCEIHRSEDRKSIEVKCEKYIESMTKKFGLLKMAKHRGGAGPTPIWDRYPRPQNVPGSRSWHPKNSRDPLGSNTKEA